MQRSKITLTVIITVLLTVIFGPIYAQETYRIGLVMWIGNDAFIAEMAELGYVEGENVTYLIPVFDETIAPEDFAAYYDAQLQIIFDAGVDILVTNTDTDAVNMAVSVGDIPIVFARSDDPVATGAVADLVNPGGNITGVITNRPHERRLQILTEINPATDKVYYLYSTLTGEAETVLQQVQAVGEELNVEVIPAPITDVASSLTALENTPNGIDWLFLTPFVPFDFAFFEALAEVSMSHQAGIAGVTDTPFPGYLIGYGPNIDATSQQAARIVDRIIRGASPAELPVQTAENYLLVNLEAAQAINWEIPEGILRQANQIVRPGFFENWDPFAS